MSEQSDNYEIREPVEKPIEEMSKQEIVVYLMKSFEHTQYGQDALDYFNKMLLRLVD